MHHLTTTTLRHLRQDLAERLEENAAHEACRQAGHTWRPCLLNPVAILHWFLIQVLNGSTALVHVSLLAGRSFTDAAFCLARARLPLTVYRAVLKGLTGGLAPDAQAEGRWHGHRTFLVDGPSSSMPDTAELRDHFGLPHGPKPGCGFPIAKILALFHAGTGALIDVIAAPTKAHEMGLVGDVRHHLEKGDVLVGDRGFRPFLHLAMLAARGAHAVVRAHARQIADFTPGRPHVARGSKEPVKGRPRSRWLRRLGEHDQVVEWFKPLTRPVWLTEARFAELPESLTLREVRYEVGRPGYRPRSVTLVTTLLDAGAYPLSSLSDLYGLRWSVALNLGHLKRTMKMDVLRCKAVDGALKELLVYALAYNLVRAVMRKAARVQREAVDRISFVDALRWLVIAGDELPEPVVSPDRPGRIQPRVVKRRPKQYMRMTRSRAEWRKRLLGQEFAAQFNGVRPTPCSPAPSPSLAGAA